MSSWNAALLMFRVVLGVTMAAHGYQKVFKGGRLEGTAGWFDSIGMRPGRIHARLAAFTELGSGALLALGLLTPLAGAAFVGLMFVASWTVHRGNFMITKNGWEYNLVLAAGGVALGGLGPGEWSLDHAFGILDNLAGWRGLAISALGGLAGAFALLGVCFRPPVTEDEVAA